MNVFIPLCFPIVPHEDRVFPNHFEVGPFSSKFIFSSAPSPFLRADEEHGCFKEVLDLFKSKIVEFTCVIFQIQDNGAHPLGIDEPPPMPLDYVSSPFSCQLALFLEIKIGFVGVSAS